MTAPVHASPDAAEPYVLRSDEGGVTTLLLNRPRQMNVLSRALLAELHAHLQALVHDTAVRVIVIAAEGKAFSAGHDMKELGGQPHDEVESLFTLCTDVMEGLRLHPKPVIARVQGVAAAAGCQLVASCDMAVAADTARFGTTGIKSGLFCGTPMVPVSRVVPTKKALEMLLTGRLISAAEAEAAGLVNRVAPADELNAVTEGLAREIADNSPYAVRLGKAAFYRQQGLDYAGAYEIGRATIVENAVHPEGQEGIMAFLEKRPARYSD